MNLDKPFSNDKWHINCETVGDVIDELSNLPRDLPVKSSFTDSVDLVVFNRKQDDVHLAFEDGEEWDDEDDDGEELEY